jgi:hypothetical protein
MTCSDDPAGTGKGGTLLTVLYFPFRARTPETAQFRKIKRILPIALTLHPHVDTRRDAIVPARFTTNTA